jgi:fluoride ion exporter CrcB/FEX
MDIITFLVEFFRNFSTQILIAELMFCVLHKPRLKIYQIVIIIGAFLAIPFLIPNFYFWDGFKIGDWFTVSFIAIMLLSIGVIWACFKIPTIKELLFYLTAAIVVQHIVYTTARAVNFIFQIKPGLNSRIVIIAAFLIIYTLFYLIFVRRLRKENTVLVRNGYILAFTFFATFLVYFLNLWTMAKETQIVSSYLLDLFCCILILLLHFGMFEWSKLEKENEIVKHLLQIAEEKHTMSTENIEMLNMKYHDLKFHISALKQMTSIDEQKESIKELEMATKFFDTYAKTGNSTLDVLLSERSLFWNKHNIHFTCIADGSKLDFMRESDIYSLFGNALDNAQESVMRIDDVEKRVISLTIVSRGNFVIINISNYYEHNIVFENGLPVTSKSNYIYHGYGMKGIKYLTEKYGGTMSILADNGIFKLNIIIPINTFAENPEKTSVLVA